jgi:integrase
MKLRETLLNWAVLRSGACKPRTQHYHREIIGTIVKLWPEKLDVEAGEISESDLAAFIPRIERYSNSRFNGVVTMLQGVLPAAKNVRRRPIRIKQRALLSPADFGRLIRALDQRPRSRAGLVIRFLAQTGMRIGEARKLKWSGVREDYLAVPGDLTKNAKGRAIPLLPEIGKTLRALKRLRSDDDLVLPQAECKRSLQSACKAAGLPRLSHHDFRHLFATRCIESGVDIPTVARWLGHQDGGALLGRAYFHLLDDHSRRMALRVSI